LQFIDLIQVKDRPPREIIDSKSVSDKSFVLDGLLGILDSSGLIGSSLILNRLRLAYCFQGKRFPLYFYFRGLSEIPGQISLGWFAFRMFGLEKRLTPVGVDRG
jgi:hypothetical protein